MFPKDEIIVEIVATIRMLAQFPYLLLLKQ
jgi:hypothetical protein